MESVVPPSSSHNDSLSRSLHHSSSERVIDGEELIRIRSPVKRLTAASSMVDYVPSGSTGEPPQFTKQYSDHLMDEGNVRAKEPRTPKSILVTPNRTPKV